MILANLNTLNSSSVMQTGSAGFCAQYQAIYDEFSSAPSDDDAAAQNTFVKALVDAGVWDEGDRLHILAAHASGADSLLDWLHPSVPGNALTLVNAPSFVAKQGYTGNGTTSYINTNYDPDVDGVKWDSNSGAKTQSGSFALYCRTNVLELNKYDFGTVGGSDIFTILYVSGALSRMKIMGETLDTGVITDTRGMHYVESYAQDPGVSDIALSDYTFNGSSVDTGSNLISKASADAYLLCVNNNGTPAAFAAKQISLLWLGASLGTTKQAALYNAFQTLMTYYGTQV